MFAARDGLLMGEWPSCSQEEAAPAARPSEAPERAIRLVLQGDTDAFGDLMALTEARVFATAWRLLGDRDQARDAAQEVFMRAFRSLASFRHGESFPAWIQGITVNVCRDHMRRRGPLMASEVALASSPERGLWAAEAALLHGEHRLLVQRALATLTPAERLALTLRDLEGLSTEETSRALGIRAVTVRTQIASARLKLKTFWARMANRTSGGRP